MLKYLLNKNVHKNFYQMILKTKGKAQRESWQIRFSVLYGIHIHVFIPIISQEKHTIGLYLFLTLRQIVLVVDFYNS